MSNILGNKIKNIKTGIKKNITEPAGNNLLSENSAVPAAMGEQGFKSGSDLKKENKKESRVAKENKAVLGSEWA